MKESGIHLRLGFNGCILIIPSLFLLFLFFKERTFPFRNLT